MMAAPQIGAVRALYAGVPPLLRRRLILVLQVYADDSGNDGESEVFVLAGFIARAEEWIAFENKWRKALEKPRSLEYFKMKECAARRKQFDGWSKSDRDAKLLELTEIIKSIAVACVYSLVRRSEFEKVFSHVFKSGPYEFVYWSLVSATLKSMHYAKIEDQVDFIFDEQLHLSDKVQSTYSTVLANMPQKLRSLVGGRPIHGSDKKYLPLQASDLLAWHIRRWYHEEKRGRNFDTPTLKILTSIPYWGMPHTQEALTSVLENAKLHVSLARMASYFRSEEFKRKILKLSGTSEN